MNAEGLLFDDESGLQKFLSTLDKKLRKSNDQDKFDLGIAFIEMGLPQIAIHIFNKAKTRRSTAVSLKSYAMIISGKAIDAVIELEGAIRDTEIELKEKAELLYLMGRAHER